MKVEAHFHHSSLREHIVEHVFVGEVLRALWRLDVFDVEVLRSEFDAHGYDLVFSRGAIVRHIQLKTGTSNKPAAVSVSQSLATKPSGCVLWIRVTNHLDLGPYFWFGSKPGKPLAALAQYNHPKRATHNKAGERPTRVNHRLIPGRDFQKLEKLDEVLAYLFGDLTPTRGVD